MKSREPNMEGKITFLNKKSFDLFIQLCQRGRIPLNISEDKINKSRKEIYVYDYIKQGEICFYVLHFVYILDKHAVADIKIKGVGWKRVLLNGGKIKIYDMVLNSRFNSQYEIPTSKSEEYYFKKIIFEVTKDKKIERELLKMKLKDEDKNGS